MLLSASEPPSISSTVPVPPFDSVTAAKEAVGVEFINDLQLNDSADRSDSRLSQWAGKAS